MKIGIVICTHNRLHYLKKCLKSIKESHIPDNAVLFFVDDGSEDKKVKDAINKFCQNMNNSFAFYKVRTGVHDSLAMGFRAAIQNGCDVLINIDSDAIVSKNWIEVLINLHISHADTIVSGFNTLSCDVLTKQPRHPIVAQRENYVLKKSIGGINMCFNKYVYKKYVEQNLRDNWDWNVCRRMRVHDKYFVVSTPSVVQHIGIEGMHNLNPDVSHDFIEV
jgi:GT2 family glycosyltransferase